MLIFDAHIDTLSRLLISQKPFTAPEGHVNLELIRGSGLGAQFFAAFVHPRFYHGLALHNTSEMIDLFWQLLREHSQDLAYAGSVSEIRRAQKEGRIACLLAIEGGEALEGKLANLRNFYRLGVRLLTLTWNHRNQLGSGQLEGPSGGGLSCFGGEVVEEMNRLGMLIDVSHLNEPGFWDVLEISSAPIIASHSNAWELCKHPRNLKDPQIRAIAERGGVIGVNFYTQFLTGSAKAEIGAVAEQIDYLVNVGGIDSVGLGSDFDGISQTPKGLENCACTKSLVPILAERGYDQRQISKIMGGNLLRLCEQVLG